MLSFIAALPVRCNIGFGMELKGRGTLTSTSIMVSAEIVHGSDIVGDTSASFRYCSDAYPEVRSLHNESLQVKVHRTSKMKRSFNFTFSMNGDPCKIHLFDDITTLFDWG